ncbi:MAG TPA: hypothetical protein DIW17_09920 [Clostridiales bacterium]|jgi:hypothetical protein|uniref:hypothetical protein n=2 Tax=Muricomes intestini TaxID=1796634 RepID=UPI000E8898F1|nr:hypothetical protein [Lachnospiraceae bacterium]HCS74179.1 hypothetical protein [Clostridiales bacterium]
MAHNYITLGILLAFLSGGCMVVCLLNVIRSETKNKKPLYLRKLPKKPYPEEFADALRGAYCTTGDIRGMLLLLQSKWEKGTAAKRIPAALDYLENSRYRDYETTFFYLSDQSADVDTILQKILEKEVRKQKGLVCKG